MPQVEARAAGTDTVRRSKLHLVDLAGSERVGAHPRGPACDIDSCVSALDWTGYWLDGVTPSQ